MITGKGNHLDFLREKLPDLPIPQYVRIKVSELSNTSLIEKSAEELAYPIIVRSDAPFEDGLGRSFAGLCDSEVVKHPAHLASAVDAVARRLDQKKLHNYYNMRRNWQTDPDFVVPDAIPIILQQYNEGRLFTVITKHPHEESYLVEFDTASASAMFRKVAAFRVASSQDLSEQLALNAEHTPLEYIFSEETKDQLLEALQNYQRIEPLFDENISYQMEASSLPHQVYQWRPFRRREFAEFSVNNVAPPEDRKTVFDVPFVIGLTPAEGIRTRHIFMNSLGGRSISMSESLMDAVMRSNMYQQNGEMLAVGTSRIGGFNAHVRNSGFENYFGVMLFSGTQREGPFTGDWQTHDAFRLLEGDAKAGFMIRSLLPEFDQCEMHYWSDGRKGRVQFFPGTKIDW